MTAEGLISSTSRNASGKRSRSSSAPSCLPAILNGGHGTPPANKSIPQNGFPENFLKSPVKRAPRTQGGLYLEWRINNSEGIQPATFYEDTLPPWHRELESLKGCIEAGERYLTDFKRKKTGGKGKVSDADYVAFRNGWTGDSSSSDDGGLL